MNVEYLSIIFADYFTLRNLSTSLHFVQTRYAAPTVHSYLMVASLSHAQSSLPAAALELAPDTELTRVL